MCFTGDVTVSVKIIISNDKKLETRVKIGFWFDVREELGLGLG